MSGSPDTFPDKHPETDRAFSIDWTKDLNAGVNEKIFSSDWEYIGDDANLTLSIPSHTDNIASIFVSGGTLMQQYLLKNTVVTDSVPPKTLVAERYLNIREVCVN